MDHEFKVNLKVSFYPQRIDLMNGAESLSCLACLEAKTIVVNFLNNLWIVDIGFII